MGLVGNACAWAVPMAVKLIKKAPAMLMLAANLES
jgi:hypothetical protein